MNTQIGSQSYPVVLHIPHASTEIPTSVRETFVLTDAELKTELLLMTDRYCDDLFDLSDCAASIVTFPVSRLVVDPERFADDAQEPMAARGMGVVYTHTSDGRPLRRALASDERASLIHEYYEPHHHRLTDAVERVLARWGWCLVLDCHSFPSAPLPYELDQTPDRPQICIGTDDYHTPAWLSDLVVKLFRDAGSTVYVNRPFSGALVPMACYRTVPQVRSLMIEVNRSLYMDETTGERLDDFNALREQLQSVLRRLVRAAASYEDTLT